MTGTPSSFAGTPDLLSELLKTVRLTASVFLNALFSAPFGVRDTRAYDDGTPMARLRHASILHMILEGSCHFEFQDRADTRQVVNAGDVVFHPISGPYQFWNGSPDQFAAASDVVEPSPLPGVWRVRHGGGGAQVRMVCGFVESAELWFAPLFRALPPLVIEHTSADPVGSLIASTVKEIAARVEQAAPGSEAVLGRLMELLFLELLRRHAERLPPSATGMFGAIRDPIVSRALTLFHAEPAHRWTVEQLAQRVGASRSVLGERFAAVLGRPPIDYLSALRIQIAADRLRSSNDNLTTIAEAVGYDSEAAFSRAFKRVTGTTPGSWRDAGEATSH